MNGHCRKEGVGGPPTELFGSARAGQNTLWTMSWPPRWCRIPAFWVLWCLGSRLLSLQAPLFGKRELPQLSSDELTVLVSGVPDPVSKLDPTNSASHLSKILIPRAREHLFFLAVTHKLNSMDFSRYGKHHSCSKLHCVNTQKAWLGGWRGRIHGSYSYRKEEIHQYYCHKKSLCFSSIDFVSSLWQQILSGLSWKPGM